MEKMIEVEGQIKKWGNSVALRMKKSDVTKGSLRMNERVRAILMPRKAVTGKDLWGKMKIIKSTEEIMREIDQDLDIEF